MRRDVTQPLLSSGDAYAGFSASFHAVDPGGFEIPESDAFRIAVHVGPPHRLWDRRDGGTSVLAHKRGDVVVTTLGERRSVRWDRASSFLSFSLRPKLVRDLVASTGADPDRTAIVGAFSHRDPYVERLAFALFRELLAGMPSGRMFGEDVAASLAAHLVDRHARSHSQTPFADGPKARVGLSKPALSRVLAYLHDAMSERISLADLADVAGLSTFHFARQFRAATGMAPHAYLVRVRVEEAARAILGGAEPSETATRVGFSSQGHLTQQMKRALGVTPGRLSRGIVRKVR